MPLYEYRCDACGEVFEIIQKFADDPLATHPACGGRVERLLSAPALQFKGTGWYVTDYGRRSGFSGGHKSESSGDAPAKNGDTAPKSETPAKNGSEASKK